MGDRIFIKDFAEFQYGSFRESKHPFHKKLVKLIENRTNNDTVSIGYQYPIDTLQDKDKDKDKDIIPDERFSAIWSQYPRRDGSKQAMKHFTTTVRTDQDYTDIRQALQNYIRYIDTNKIEHKFIKMGSTWFNNWRDWIEVMPENKGQRRRIF